MPEQADPNHATSMPSGPRARSAESAFVPPSGPRPCRDPQRRYRQLRGHVTDGAPAAHLTRLPAGALQAPLDGDHGVPARRSDRSPSTRSPRRRIYRRRVQILIENENPNVVKFKEVYDQNQTTARLLPDAVPHPAEPRAGPADDRSGEAVGPSAVRRIRPVGRASTLSPIAWAGASARVVPRLRRPAKREAAESPAPPRDADAVADVIDTFLDGAHGDAGPQQPAGGRRVQLARSRSVAARVANALAKHYIEQNLEFKFLASKEATDWLGERAGRAAQGVEQSEQALQQYREQTDAVALEDRAEHRRAEAGGPERRGDARQDRADPEGGGLQPDPRHPERPRRRSTRSRPFSTTRSSSSRRAS